MHRLRNRRAVLVVGDVMLDSFIYGSVNRISPEAATPILKGTREDRMIGGAANVARGVAALGARVTLATVTGDDEWANQIARECQAFGIEWISTRDTTRETTRKVRFVSEEHSSHLLRLDWESSHALAPGVEAQLVRDVEAAVKLVDCVVLSDYNKGCLTPRVIRAAIDGAIKYCIPVLVDPKRDNPNIFSGATIIKPNRHELGGKACVTEQDFVEAATSYGARTNAKAVLVTRGDLGMTLYRRAEPAIHIPAQRVRVRDVSGAGDTVLATLAVCLACDMTIESALQFASDAAAIAVSKPGTASVTREELLAPKGKIINKAVCSGVETWPLLNQRLREWRGAGLTIGFTNGCFDILHPGHMKLLTEARAACNRLIVGLNSDDSVRALKGDGRPVQNWRARADVLACIEGVDLIVEFASNTPLALIEDIQPNVIIKGSDYRPEDVCGHTIAPVKIVESIPGVSTSQLMKVCGTCHKPGCDL